MTNKTIIGLDLDNTFSDFSGAMRNFIAYTAGITEKDVIDSIMPAPTGYSMENWSWEHTPFTGFLDAFMAAEETGNLYSTMEVFDGAPEAISQLSLLDYDVHVVTARKPAFEDETRQALESWGVDNIAKMVFTNEKYNYPADIFIDDAPSHLTAFGERNIPAIAFTNGYNAHFDDSEMGLYGRIDNWSNAVNMFQKVREVI